jgi:hypothetical protein
MARTRCLDRLNRRGALILLAALLLTTSPARAQEAAAVDFKCKAVVVPGTDRRAADPDAYMEKCIRGWLPAYVGNKTKGTRPSGKATVTSYASIGDGAACGPEGDDEGGDAAISFIALVPVTGEPTVTKLVLKIETSVGFCHEKAQTRLTGTINKVTSIR